MPKLTLRDVRLDGRTRNIIVEKLSSLYTQGKGNVILINNSKGKFPHNPLLFFSHPLPYSYEKKKTSFLQPYSNKY